MQLTKLEISGFKSFAKKTELIFKNGITGILGPNGCGKSNIADAFRFVLGEQNARALRGKRIDDFIFGGTEKRKPLSYCEVSMYFDNSDGLLASPFSEVVVTRRAFRSGESEYSINKTPARLRDIRELFRDTGIGKDGYSIIGQGRVSEILSDRSDDRREVFEEAAGVMKYRARKEEAERKLQGTAKIFFVLKTFSVSLKAGLSRSVYRAKRPPSTFGCGRNSASLKSTCFYISMTNQMSGFNSCAALPVSFPTKFPLHWRKKRLTPQAVPKRKSLNEAFPPQSAKHRARLSSFPPPLKAVPATKS